MAVLINPRKHLATLKKTDCKCSICGTKEHLVCRKFIPHWIPLSTTDFENLIPICTECDNKYEGRLIELGSLSTLPEVFIQMLIRYYLGLGKFMYKYILMFGTKKGLSVDDVKTSLLILESYNQYAREHFEDITWEGY